MDLQLSEQQEDFRRRFRAWLGEHLPRPLPYDPHEAFQARRAWQGELAAAGYVGAHWPTEYGGRGAGPMERMIIDEEMARAGAPPIAGQIGVANVAGALLAMGSPEQKASYLDAIRTGHEIWCQGMSEPAAGSDLANITTRAVLDGEEFVVDGQKIWCSDAHEADRCQLYVRTTQSERKHHGITCLIVDMHTPGIDVRPIRTITGESHFNEIFFDGARIPARRVIGQTDQGWAVAMATLMHERAGTLSLEVMLRQGLADLRRVGSAPGPAGPPALDDPVLRRAFASVWAQTHILHSVGLRMISQMERSGMPGAEGSIITLFWSEITQELAELGLRVIDGDAVLDGFDAAGGGKLQLAYLGSRAATIAAGTSEVQRNIIAERVLGLPKSA